MKLVVSECKRRTNPRKCLKHFRILVEKGKDVEKIFKLKREQKKIEKNQNGELSKRLDLLEEKTESELRWIFSHTHAFQFLAIHTSKKCTHSRTFLFLYF